MRTLVSITASVAAFSSVAYELLLASYATFLLGASVFQYSLVISLMMASMGVGALTAQGLRQNALRWMALIEIVLALAACLAIPLLYWLFAVGGPAQAVVLLLVWILGMGLGMEIPLLNHLERENRWLNDILFFDYLGGFLGGLIFPLWLLPQLGFFRLAALLGCLNASLAVAFAWKAKSLRVLAAIVWVLALAAVVFAEPLRLFLEARYFGIHS